MAKESKRVRKRKRRVIKARHGEGVLILEPSMIRVHGSGRLWLEITTEEGKLKQLQRDIDSAPPGVV